jgi:hypothetical protein
MNYSQSLTAAREEARALGERLHGKVLTSDLRSRVALGCFAVAQQHHSGIIVLLSHPLPLHASAFALLRPMAEATFRGFWVARCATEAKVENILSGNKKQIDTATIVRELIEAAGQSGKHSDFYSRVWPRLSVHTHTYEESLDPWLRGQDIESKFTEEELLSLLKRASLSAQLVEAGVLSLLAQPENAA